MSHQHWLHRILLLCAVIGCSRASRQTLPARCDAPSISDSNATSIAIKLSSGRRPTAAELADVAVATTGVAVNGACAVGATVSYGNHLGGGIAIFRDVKALAAGDLLALESYAGAKVPFSAGDGRLGFTYVSQRGSGLLEENTVVLCALDVATWIACASAITKLQVSGVGTAKLGSATLASLSLQSTTAMYGDTLYITSLSRWTSAGRDAGTTDTIVSRLVLPRAPR
jgi:hypothetical protein